MPKLLLLAALFAQQPDPWCADLHRIAAAPDEKIPFRTLRKAEWAPKLFAGCFPTHGGYFCHRSMLPPELTADSAAARIAACLEGAAIETTENRWRKRRTVLSPTLRVRITETGDERAHVGRMMDIMLSPASWHDDSDD